MVDAETGGVDRRLSSGKKAKLVFELSATERYLFRLLWLASGGSRAQQINLGLCGDEAGLKTVPEILDPRADPLYFIAEVVQFGIALVWTAKITFQAVKFALPTCMSLQARRLALGSRGW